MLSSVEACKQRVYLPRKNRLKKYGRIRAVVLHPNKAQVVGYIVKRPDLLWMFKRKDGFVAFDRILPCEGGVEADVASDAWNAAACKRLGVDYDACVIWDGMPVETAQGTKLGHVSDVEFDEETGAVVRIDISTDGLARSLLGASAIERSSIRGLRNGCIVVDDEVANLEEEGGIAAAAGEAWAKTKHTATQAAAGAASRAGELAGKGAAAAGSAAAGARKRLNDAVDVHEEKKEAEQASGDLSGVDKAAHSLGKQLGRASGMFKDFKKEFDDASR